MDYNTNHQNTQQYEQSFQISSPTVNRFSPNKTNNRSPSICFNFTHLDQSEYGYNIKGNTINNRNSINYHNNYNTYYIDFNQYSQQKLNLRSNCNPHHVKFEAHSNTNHTHQQPSQTSFQYSQSTLRDQFKYQNNKFLQIDLSPQIKKGFNFKQKYQLNNQIQIEREWSRAQNYNQNYMLSKNHQNHLQNSSNQNYIVKPFQDSPISLKSYQNAYHQNINSNYEFKIQTVKCQFFDDKSQIKIQNIRNNQNQQNQDKNKHQNYTAPLYLNQKQLQEHIKTQDFFEEFQNNYIVKFQGEEQQLLQKSLNIFDKIQILQPQNQVFEEIDCQEISLFPKQSHQHNLKDKQDHDGLALSVYSNFQIQKHQSQTERSPSKQKESQIQIQKINKNIKSMLEPKENQTKKGKIRHRIIKQNPFKSKSTHNNINQKINLNSNLRQLEQQIITDRLSKVQQPQKNENSNKGIKKQSKNKYSQIIKKKKVNMINQPKLIDENTPPIHNIPNALRTMKRTYSRTFYSSLNPSKTWKLAHTLKPSQSINSKFSEKISRKNQNIFACFNANKIKVIEFNPHNPQTNQKQKLEKQTSKSSNVWRYARRKRSDKQKQNNKDLSNINLNLNVNLHKMESITSKIKDKKMNHNRQNDNIFKQNFIFGNHTLKNTWCCQK